MRLVIRDSSAWRLIWSRLHWHDPRRPPEPLDPPPVDFREFLVVVASIGFRGCHGYSIRIDSLYLTPEEPARVVVTTTTPPDVPGRGCLGLARPVDVVRLPIRELGEPPLSYERALAFEERTAAVTRRSSR